MSVKRNIKDICFVNLIKFYVDSNNIVSKELSNMIWEETQKMREGNKRISKWVLKPHKELVKLEELEENIDIAIIPTSDDYVYEYISEEKEGLFDNLFIYIFNYFDLLSAKTEEDSDKFGELLRYGEMDLFYDLYRLYLIKIFKKGNFKVEDLFNVIDKMKNKKEKVLIYIRENDYHENLNIDTEELFSEEEIDEIFSV